MRAQGAQLGHPGPGPRRSLEEVQGHVRRQGEDKILAQAHERIVDNAYWLWVAHDINVHAVNPNVKNYKPAISWHQDYTQLYIE